MTAIFRLFGLIAIFAMGVGATLAYQWASPDERTAEDWVAEARAATLTPCFSDLILVRLNNQILEERFERIEAGRADDVDPERIITGGHHKGHVVPENCFAVATGLYGFNITFWQRPYRNGAYDMSIPYWNPDPEQIGVDEIEVGTTQDEAA